MTTTPKRILRVGLFWWSGREWSYALRPAPRLRPAVEAALAGLPDDGDGTPPGGWWQGRLLVEPAAFAAFRERLAADGVHLTGDGVAFHDTLAAAARHWERHGQG
jgi:hypothetical protein